MSGSGAGFSGDGGPASAATYKQPSHMAFDEQEWTYVRKDGSTLDVNLVVTAMLDADGVKYRLQPGMQVSAEIHLGTRTVLEYLLSPVQKAFQEAARER